MGALEDSFCSTLLKHLQHAGWAPSARRGADRRQYFGVDRQREWIQPDFWATLHALPDKPTVLAEIDTVPSDLEHNVAKYLWWTSKRAPFWTQPAILFSAFTEPRLKNFALHEAIAGHLGDLLSAAAPGTTHRVIGVRGEPKSPDVGRRLADIAFETIQRAFESLKSSTAKLTTDQGST